MFQIDSPVRFEIRQGKKLKHGGYAQGKRIAYLNEAQSYFLLTLSRNTKHVVSIKYTLVQAFERFRRNQQTAQDYIPFYHELHDVVKAVAKNARANGSKASPEIFHMNFNKLINKTCGIKAGQRKNLTITERMNVTAASAVIAATVQRGVDTGLDHHDIYQQAKQAANSSVYVKQLMIAGGQ